MFVVGVASGVIARSSGLIADGLDMLADAIAYAIAVFAFGRTNLFKANAARASGLVLFTLGVGVFADVGRRILTGEPPEGWIMIAVATVALTVNANVLRMLSKQRSKEVHFRATVIFTQVDVIANVAVILSGAIVIATGFRFIDLAVGAAIASYILKEALEILEEAREARKNAL
jgi:Co/Zn/Cd efflux system component